MKEHLSVYLSEFGKATHSQGFEPFIILRDDWERRTKELIPEGDSIKERSLYICFWDFLVQFKIGKSTYMYPHTNMHMNLHTYPLIRKSHRDYFTQCLLPQ